MSLLSGIETLLKIKPKQQAQRPQAIAPAVAQASQPVTRYEDGSARVGNVGTQGTIAQAQPQLQAVQAVPQAGLGINYTDPTTATGAQGVAQSPQGQSNIGYIPLQNSGQGGPGYGANLQPAGSNPQLEYLRRLLGQ